MSQYPQPFQTPPTNVTPQSYAAAAAGYGYDPVAYLLAPARRASILMFVLAALGICCGGCLGIVGALAPIERVLAQGHMTLPSASELGMSPAKFLQIAFLVFGGGTFLVAVAFAILAIFVRRGSSGASITSLVLCILLTILLLLQSVGGLLQSMRDPSQMVGLVVLAVPLGLLVLQSVWLFGAIKACNAASAMRAQLQTQLWQQQQQQQAYAAQSAYGYAAPPVNPPRGGSNQT